jgi:Methyltransferase domain
LAGHRSKEHAPIGDIVADVPGWLQPEDELKLYELAHAAAGPILEIGTYRGRSTTIMALAAEAGAGAFIVSVDVDPQAQAAARAALDRHKVAHRVVLVRGSSAGALKRLRGLRPSLTFIDGDHSVEGVTRDLKSLEPDIPPGGLLLFHDFDANPNDDLAFFGVRQGVRSSWVTSQCDFVGIFGACGLFRRRDGQSQGTTGPIVDAVWRDPPRLQYLQRLRWPAGQRRSPVPESREALAVLGTGLVPGRDTRTPAGYSTVPSISRMSS